jgi:hypothetical protein
MLFYEETILCPEKVKSVSVSRLKHLVGEFTRTRNNDQLRLVKRELQRRGINESVYIVTENEYNEKVVRAVRLSEDEDEPKRNRPRRTSKQRRATNPLTNADFAATVVGANRFSVSCCENQSHVTSSPASLPVPI